LAGRLEDGATGAEFVAVANQYLFGELGFNGNVKNYYDPSNSCLNQVLTERTGIPITLCLVYMEIARRLAKPVYGIGLPGHFIVQYDDGEFQSFIDPFHGGTLLNAEECYELARRSSGEQVAADPSLLVRVGKQHMIRRMINNLRAVYFFRRSYQKALKVLDLLVAANPESADEYKAAQRSPPGDEELQGGAQRSGALPGARAECPDREPMEKQLRALKQYIAGMN